MSPREALNLFDQVAASFTGNRQGHINLQGATAVLNGLVLKAEAEQKQAADNIESAAKKTVEAGKGKKEAPEE